MYLPHQEEVPSNVVSLLQNNSRPPEHGAQFLQDSHKVKQISSVAELGETTRAQKLRAKKPEVAKGEL